VRSTIAQLATVVDTKALWQTVVFATVAGVGVTFAFTLALLGAARSIDLSRDGRSTAAFASAILAAIALAVVAAAIVLGIVVMTTK
jgi:predicted RNA methylase